MTQKLVELAKETSFEKMVYTGSGSIILNLLSLVIVMSMHYVFLYDLHYWKYGFQFKLLLAPVILITSLVALFLIGNRYSKRNLKVPLIQWNTNPRSAYNEMAMAKLMITFHDPNVIYSTISFEEAKDLLDKEYDKLKSEYRKIYLVFSASVAVVWYHFVAHLFDHLFFQSLNAMAILFIALTGFCAALGWFYFIIRSVFFMKSKLGNIHELSILLEQCHFETREAKK